MEIGQCGGIQEQQWRRMVTEFGEHGAGEWTIWHHHSRMDIRTGKQQQCCEEQ